jgi:ribosomal protein S18 acetylase RimI-like enzyme
MIKNFFNRILPARILIHEQKWKEYTSWFLMDSKGRGMLRITNLDNVFDISDFYVEEPYRNHGIGSKIINLAIKLCKQRKTTETTIQISTNENTCEYADAWYKKLGFQFIGFGFDFEDDKQDLSIKLYEMKI